MAINVNQQLCTGCGECVEICPVEAITLIVEKASIDQEDCMECGACQAECPFEAIQITG
ncbi:indolepyruvate ferredoxin oxidoreductase subunit alpha [bacterium]